MVKKAEYKVFEVGNAGGVQSQIAAENAKGEFWKPILMTSCPIPPGVKIVVILERVLEST